MTESHPALRARIARDHLYIDAAAYDDHLAHIGSVALLRDGDDLVILPITGTGSGGFYIKQVNAHGDRAVHAADFFRLHGIDETREHRVEACWDERIGGFSVRGFFAVAAAPAWRESELDFGRSSA